MHLYLIYSTLSNRHSSVKPFIIKMMAVPEKRQYRSLTRQRQADETRQRIMDVARKLFLSNGYSATTIDSIAADAGVATQTVYAVFGSKKAILAEVIENVRFGSVYEENVKEIRGVTDPRKRLQLVARIARQIYDSERAEYKLLRAAPEIAEQEQELENLRFEKLKFNVRVLKESGHLKKDLKEDEVLDILWTLTGRDNYRMLV